MSTATCKYCGCVNLLWKQMNGRWALTYESGGAHRCLGQRSAIAKRIRKPEPTDRLLIGFTKEGAEFYRKRGYGPLEIDPASLPPPEAINNLEHPWWDFLKAGETIEEAIP